MPVAAEHSGQDAAFAYCEQVLRDHGRTYWLASLFIPQDKRGFVQALYAFAVEVERIHTIVSEPAIGEIRLQWWVEALRGERAGEAAANPVAAALLETTGRFSLPAQTLINLVEARRFDLYNDPMPSLNDLEGYCGETVSVLFRLASMILCKGPEPDTSEASGHAGVAFGVAEILAGLPVQATRGQCYLPKDILDRNGALPQAVAAGLATEPLRNALAELRGVARSHLDAARAELAGLDGQVRPAFVLLSQVAPLLKRMEKRGYDPFSSEIALPQWRSQWAMWRWR